MRLETYPSKDLRESAAAAFTLIELLVVVSIIALLVSIMLPSLSLARENAKNVVCKSNMKQMGMALFLYSDEHDQIMVTEDAALTTVEDGGEMRSLPWQAILLPYVGRDIPDLSRHWAMEEAYRVFECPSQKDRWDWFDNASIRYGINTAFCSHYTIRGGGKVVFLPKKNSSVETPSRRMHLADTLDDSAERAQEFITSGTLAPTRNWLMSSAIFGFAWDSPPSDRHRGYSNLIFVDGHLESLKYEEIMPMMA